MRSMPKKSKRDFDREFEEASRLTDADVDHSTVVVVYPTKRPKSVFNFSPAYLKSLREKKLKKSQSEFARLLGISVSVIQQWEQGRRKPQGPALALIRIVAAHPEMLTGARP